MILINSFLFICLLIISSNAQLFENIPSTSYKIPGGRVDSSSYYYNIPSSGQQSANIHSSLIYSKSALSTIPGLASDYQNPVSFRQYQASNVMNYPTSTYNRIPFSPSSNNPNNYLLISPKISKPSENLLYTSSNNFNQPINMDNMMKELESLRRSAGFTYMVPENMANYKQYLAATNGFGSELNIKNPHISQVKYISAPNYSPSTLYAFSTQHSMANHHTVN